MEQASTLIQSASARFGSPRSEPAERQSSELAPSPRSESVLGRYRLIERLGAGGFGVVWRAHDEQLDREVALKRIALPSPEDRERATREALATARLSHPAIVALYEACSDEHAFYLVSELIDGETLAELIAADELPDEQIVEVGLAIADALGHAHARGVIHRDVKPPNVIVVHEPLGRAGVAKLADFGGAQLIGEEALTRTGDVLGTLAYMSPEQCEGAEVDEAADVYSLALVLYEALAGVHPVRGRNAADTARRIGLPIERLERHRRDLPRELTRAIDAALQTDPLRRATLAELREALAEAAEAHLDGDVRARPDDEPVSSRAWAADSRPSDRRPTSVRSTDPRFVAAGSADAPSVDSSSPDLPSTRRHVSVPRAAWLAAVVGVAAWQALAGRTGVSVLALAAGAPLVALGRRAGPGWLTAALAPALGLQGLAGAYPALAGQPARWRTRAGVAALGAWWLALAEPLLGRRLWEGPAAGTPPTHAWEGSPSAAAVHVIGSLLTTQLLVQVAVWALACAILPLIVRGRSAALDVAGALTWTVALLAGGPLLQHALGVHDAQSGPRGALLGAVLGCVLAVCARAVRGPV